MTEEELRGMNFKELIELYREERRAMREHGMSYQQRRLHHVRAEQIQEFLRTDWGYEIP